MKISLIIPTRSRPDDLRGTLAAAFETALEPDQVEPVCRLDTDDPWLESYLCVLREYPRAVYIIGQRRQGYASLVEFMDECAAIATGDQLMCFNDDMLMRTPGWDKIIESAMAGRPLAVGIGRLTLNGDPENQCQYACAVIPRPLYKLCGGIRLGGTLDLDRCWEAVATFANCEVRMPIAIEHRQNFNHTPDTDDSRNDYSGKLHANWGARSAEWEVIGRRYANMILAADNF